ncbi:MAG: energy transducer TonB [Rhodoferax sp.]|nr:energy transducer TonB [Rhodoferax sp.]
MVCLILGVLAGHVALLAWLQTATSRDAAVAPAFRLQLATTAPIIRPNVPAFVPTPSAMPLRPAFNKVKTAGLAAAQTQTKSAELSAAHVLVADPAPSAATGFEVIDKPREAGFTPSAQTATAALALTTPAAPAAPANSILPSEKADYLNNPAPGYPAISRRLGEQGKVVIRVLIGKDGLPQQGNIDQSSGYSRLDQVALRAVMGWRYVPGQRNGTAQDMWYRVPIHFALNEDPPG